jgi:acyl-CoA thioester hydrolase
MKSKNFEMRIKVSAAHLDENEHVNNVQYLQWSQDVAKAHWEQEAEQSWLDHYYWVALNHYIEYISPAHLGDSLIIKTHIKEFSGVKSQRFVRIYHAKSEKLICECITHWCMLSRSTQKPARITKEMEAAFQE